ncbi:MAG: DNA (cytosine-5-)-methyltransferase [Mycoplasma sp.]
MKFNILDLFFGEAGFSLGFDMEKQFSTKIGVDFDADALKTFQKNFPKAITIQGDISEDKIKKLIIDESKKQKINMIIGGPPCQGFSLKGKNLGLDDPRNFLFKEYLEVVSIIQPEIFIIENVKNLYNSNNGYFKNLIKDEIEKMGYIVNAGVINAKNYGVPQNRERTFFIASKNKFINLPKKTNEFITVYDAISDLSFLESGEGQMISNYIFPAKSKYQEKMRHSHLLNHIATSHSDLAIHKLKMIPPEKGKEYLPKEFHGKQKFSTTWSRLIWNDVSPTIDTRFDTPSNGKNSHPFLHRAITAREAARIQSFPDWFEFLGKKCSICRQIGNAVPPLLANKIARQIILELNAEAFKTDNYDVINGDAYSIIDELEKKGTIINHVITDPPYNISVENNFNTLSSPRKGIDFGEWDKNFDLLSWIPKYSNILHKNGSFIVFCSYRFLSDIIRKMEGCNLEVKDVIVWRKSNPMPRNTNRRYVQDMEFAVWAVKKNAKWVFNKPNDTPYLRSFFSGSTVLGKERTEHPTQKSIKLMEEILRIHTNEGEVIIDPFMGSGTTGVAALNLNRKFIGIELDKKYFSICLKRLNKEL